MYVKVNEALYLSSNLTKRVVVYKDLGIQVFSENGKDHIEPIGALNDVVSVDRYVLWLAAMAAQDEDAYSIVNNGKKVYRFGGWSVNFSEMGKNFSIMNINLGRHSAKLLVKNERRSTFEASVDD